MTCSIVCREGKPIFRMEVLSPHALHAAVVEASNIPLALQWCVQGVPSAFLMHAMYCSFAVVIQRLPPELRDAVCIFYLVLRALDTVEDDMAIKVDVKVPLLRVFHEKIYDR